MPVICTLTGGAWQDTHGNVVANGTLVLTLCQDAVVASSNQVAPTTVTFPLDANGNLQSGATVYGNDALSPAGTFYFAEVLNSGGSKVWGREIWTLTSGTTNASTIVPAQANAQIVSPLTIETNGINNASQVLLNFQDTASVTWSNPSGGNVQATAAVSGGPFLSQRFVQVISDGSNNPFTIGHGDQPGSIGNRTLPQPTATESAGDTFTSSAVGSTNVTASILQGFDGNRNGKYSYGAFFNYATRLRFNNTTNCRFWLGLLGKGSQNLADFATDTPGTSFTLAAFRFSSTTDTVIQCVVGSGSAQTVASSGVSVDTTNSQFFEIIRNGSTSFDFKIGGALVATVSGTQPAASALFGWGWYGDNKNTATAVGATHWFSTMSIK